MVVDSVQSLVGAVAAAGVVVVLSQSSVVWAGGGAAALEGADSAAGAAEDGAAAMTLAHMPLRAGRTVAEWLVSKERFPSGKGKDEKGGRATYRQPR